MEGGVMQARSAASVEPFDATLSQLRLLFERLQNQAYVQRTSPHDLERTASTDPAGEEPSWVPTGSDEPFDASGWRAW
jgi:hypothetical protein